MKRIIDSIPIQSDGVHYSALRSIVHRVYEDKCNICVGLGHVAKDCATKKDADKHFKLLRYGLEWGAVKSTIMSRNMLETGSELRKRAQEMIAASSTIERPKRTKPNEGGSGNNNQARAQGR